MFVQRWQGLELIFFHLETQFYDDWLNFFLATKTHEEKKLLYVTSRESNPGELATQADALSITPWPLGQITKQMSAFLTVS